MEIDTRDITNFAAALATAPKEFQATLKKGLDGLLSYGVKTAKGFAPKQTGALAAAIRVLEPTSIGATITGSYGVQKTSALPYPFMREYGGTIVPVRAKYLVFRGRDGGLVFAKSVTQKGTRYMNRSFDIVRPRLIPVAEAAAARLLARFG